MHIVKVYPSALQLPLVIHTESSVKFIFYPVERD